MLYLRQSQQEILKEEERRYRFLAEKHCGLTQSLLFLINKVCIHTCPFLPATVTQFTTLHISHEEK